MSDPVTISEAKTHQSRLVARAERGEEVLIRRGDRPVVRLVALEPRPPTPRSPIGALRGEVWIAADFDDLGPEWGEHT